MTQIEAIADKLTEAQRRAILCYMPDKGRWRMCGIIFWSLEDLGIVRRRANPGGTVSCQPTPLGLAVRAHLTKDASI